MVRSRGVATRAGSGLLLLASACLALLTRNSCFVSAPNRGTSGLAAGVLLPSAALAQEAASKSPGTPDELVESWRAFSANPDQFQPSALDPEAPEWQLGTLTGRADQEFVFLCVGAAGLVGAFITAFILPDPKDEPVDIEAAKRKGKPEWVRLRDLKEDEEVQMKKEALEQARRRGPSGGMMPR
ncbi:unnamed protein product [Effrenium voratum]|nr:unnamed protein product [Effrenium voratum]CAJ1427716.1 unnamed protein product [Effrenium voratum]|mmetsp:Transcript_136572/g.323489  ORF Transcript_136572/g.323489 Transcript_136572/m.323489 type:complete len:184 (-) Transcript_136572:157-708(-)|eukprot:CAMPEP_0181455348 /NCGR_PEP_ID=MMETSP1110-20121109/30713_1 /TAXON_ID=174948 /ORGANISM="Symbiodinium sp., Strain CCMP421" /LENGTH=183 /DNA_ID=CAMNT_0023579733 /DNA_START=72 /DNA_END=623 /DNA_ORIENTATION=+